MPIPTSRPRRLFLSPAIRVAGPPSIFSRLDDQFDRISYFIMSALRVAARRLPRASRLVPSIESPIQRRFAATSNAPQDVKRQVEVCPTAQIIGIGISLC